MQAFVHPIPEGDNRERLICPRGIEPRRGFRTLPAGYLGMPVGNPSHDPRGTGRLTLADGASP
jgi:hypothetical protein